MINFFTSLKTKIESIASIQHVRMWNNQLDTLFNGESYMFPFPAVFIEFDTSQIQQLGEGRQLYNPLIFKLHICNWQLDAGDDATFEQNLEIYTLKNTVYTYIQKFQPGLTDENNPAGSCIRILEEQDYSHKGVYHYIQTYKTTLVDYQMTEPVNGGEFDPTQDIITSGTLTINEYYEILNVSGGADFINVGAASNTVGVIFKATGTTPTAWGTGSVQLYHSKVDIEALNEQEVTINTYQFPTL